MNRLMHVTGLAGLLFLASCSLFADAGPVENTDPGDDPLVWVSRAFSGGQQCDPNDRYTPPDTAQLLRSYGVTVFEGRVEMLYVCAACGCPQYAALHFALIRAEDLALAKDAGFVLTDADQVPNPRQRSKES